METDNRFDFIENINNNIDSLYKALGALNATAILLSRQNSIRDEGVELRGLECAIDSIDCHLDKIVSLIDELYSKW